jgi:FixJ family two-component response regulator
VAWRGDGESGGEGEGRGLTRKKLTIREREVLDRLAAGAAYKVIAFDLGIEQATARVLGSRALRKRGVSRLALQARTHLFTR